MVPRVKARRLLVVFLSILIKCGHHQYELPHSKKVDPTQPTREIQCIVGNAHIRSLAGNHHLRFLITFYFELHAETENQT
eukprot:m.467822 g.467822  ORF g.467822 m.467822 type:complete len:80 (+) comp26898_c0_seq1:1093-1332(+)